MGEIHLHKAKVAADEGDLDRAREFYSKAIGCFGPEELQGAEARVGVAVVFAELDALDDAWSALSEAQPALERCDDLSLYARALNQMGSIRRRQEALDEAEALHIRARKVAGRAGDLRQQAVALRNVAGIERERGNLERTVALLEESAELHSAEGELRSVALIWRQIRTVELEAGHPERAYQAALRELGLRESLGEEAAVAASLTDAASLARVTGRYCEADTWLQRAAELRARGRDMEGACNALLAAAGLLLDLGRPRAARRKLEAARDALGERGFPEQRAKLWRYLAETDLVSLEAYQRDDDPMAATDEEGFDVEVTTDSSLDERQLLRRAREQADEALRLCEHATGVGPRIAATRAVARACALQRDLAGAREQFRASVAALEELREEPWELDGSYATFLHYGRWLSRLAPSEGEATDQRAAQDYLERAAIRAEESIALGVCPHAAARARAALSLHHRRAGDQGAAAAQLELARTSLSGREDSSEPGLQLRAGLAAVERLLRFDPLGSGRLLEAAEEVARKSLARLSPDDLRDALYDLRRLQEISKALNSELELDRLLGLIIDASIDLMGAERGFLILTGSKRDEVAFRVARNMERTEVERPDRKVSNTIARLVIERGEPVSTGDATKDHRFVGTSSVSAQRLRSVAAVPLRVKGTVTGALYVDHRYKGDLFGPLAVELLEGLADNAAIALENARLIMEDEGRRATLDAQKRLLQGRVASQSQELETVRERLAEKTRAEGSRYRYENIIGQSAAMAKVFRLLDKVVTSTIPVFIHGESGTGKELIARAIHHGGARAEGPFVSENFAAIVDGLLESELFGHVKGSFTGAIADKKGIFERASGGTIFLDEVGDLSEQMQKELLRVLEEREVRPVGSPDVIPVDVRVISATHQDLKKMVALGTFRQDLFYRLHVLAVELPPLRERREDIPALVDRFLDDCGRAAHQPPKRIHPEAMKKLLTCRWPGNVRELKNFVDRTALLCRGDEIRPEDVVLESEPGDELDPGGDLSLSKWGDAKQAFARRYLRSVLSRVGGNISLAARESGMLRQAFQRLLKRHGVDPDDYRVRPRKT